MADQPPTILVVDDMNTSSLEKILASEGYGVYTADSGPAALRTLQEERVDLVLLDIVMPGMDGYEVLRRIRAQFGNSIPVLLASARYTDSLDVVHGLQIGADDYLFKPFDLAELKARIVAKLRQRELEKELRQARQEAEAQNELLRRVLGIVQAATSSLDPDSLASAVLRGLHQELKVPRAAVWRTGADHGPLSLPAETEPLPAGSWEAIHAGEPFLRVGERVMMPMRIADTLVGVLDLDWGASWNAGATTILKALADSLAILFQNTRYMRQIARENTFHELLNQLASRDASLTEMLAELRQFLDSHLILISRWLTVLVHEPLPTFLTEGHLLPGIVEHYQATGVVEQMTRRRRAIVVEPTGALPFHRLFPVVLGGELTAFLIAVPQTHAGGVVLAPEGEMERAARFLAGVLQRRREVDLRGQQLRTDFVNDFLSGRLADEISRPDLFMRANALELNLAQPGFVARIELPGFDELVDWTQPLFEQRIAELLTPLLREAQAAREALGLEGIEVASGGSIVTIISLAGQVTEEQARRMAKLWADKVLDSYEHRRARHMPALAIGLGRLATAWQELPRSADEAERALRWVLSSRRTSTAYYGDLGSERLLAAIGDRTELVRFHREQLQPLIAYDAEREGELVRTLQAFFASGGHMSRAADLLSIHPNTLKYRLDQVAQLTHRDPRDPDFALDLQLALKIHTMI